MDQLGVYEILVKQNEQMLFAYIMGIVKDQSWAEDIVQEAFVKAYENLASLKNKEAFGSWLRTIARNVALVELKRKKKEITIEPQILMGMEDIFSHAENREGDLWGEKVQFVKECFDSLPENLNMPCKLHYYDNLKTAEVADLLQITLANVLKRLERSRAQIKVCVEKKVTLLREKN
jgi:RNA polymerase sigma factor (sigma-70 family)